MSLGTAADPGAAAAPGSDAGSPAEAAPAEAVGAWSILTAAVELVPGAVESRPREAAETPAPGLALDSASAPTAQPTLSEAADLSVTSGAGFGSASRSPESAASAASLNCSAAAGDSGPAVGAKTGTTGSEASAWLGLANVSLQAAADATPPGSADPRSIVCAASAGPVMAGAACALAELDLGV